MVWYWVVEFLFTPEQLCGLENVTTPSIDSEILILDILFPKFGDCVQHHDSNCTFFLGVRFQFSQNN